MAYLTSASRRMALLDPTGSGETYDDPLDDQQVDDEEAAISSPYERWHRVAELIHDRDSDLVRAWADQADGLVTFAALFSGIITSFILQNYTALKPDPQLLTVVLLNEISARLNGTTLPGIDITQHASPFQPELSDVLQNSALFASLVCSLLAAGMGIFYKEWLRQYTRGTPTDPRWLVRVREHRHRGMVEWRMQMVISGISLFLQLGVGFFIAAVILFAWPLHPIVRLVLNVFSIIWTAFWIGTAFCPLLSNRCPFRSPLSRFFYSAVVAGRNAAMVTMSRILPRGLKPSLLPRTLEDEEWQEVNNRASDLDVAALKYVYEARWGDPRLAELDACVEELPYQEATTLLDQLCELHRQDPNDSGTARLRELRGRLGEGKEGRSAKRSRSWPSRRSMEDTKQFKTFVSEEEVTPASPQVRITRGYPQGRGRSGSGFSSIGPSGSDLGSTASLSGVPALLTTQPRSNRSGREFRI
ncbi:hypothetical protein C8Q77DRAFT_128394 [Trametes polyzona]|nr:hypothetical protein C8Q77DRAFT_128394 [Trametes polyzona]